MLEMTTSTNFFLGPKTTTFDSGPSTSLSSMQCKRESPMVLGDPYCHLHPHHSRKTDLDHRSASIPLLVPLQAYWASIGTHCQPWEQHHSLNFPWVLRDATLSCLDRALEEDNLGAFPQSVVVALVVLNHPTLLEALLYTRTPPPSPIWSRSWPYCNEDPFLASSSRSPPSPTEPFNFASADCHT